MWGISFFQKFEVMLYGYVICNVISWFVLIVKNKYFYLQSLVW